MEKRVSFGRKKLSDISNIHQQIDLEDTLIDASSAKLKLENMKLVKLLEEKNKTIELAGLELQKLQVNLQKLQQQNWNLAQSNSHLLAELNLGKDKLKLLRHEFMCKEALLKAKSIKVKDQVAVMEESTKKRCTNREVSRPIRSLSLGSSSMSQQKGVETKIPDNKRQCVRRKSTANLKIQESKQSEDLFDEIEEKKEKKQCDNSTEKNVMKDEGYKGHLRRSSIGRPSRRAAEKVQSYKEIPLNVKMRKPE